LFFSAELEEVETRVNLSTIFQLTEANMFKWRIPFFYDFVSTDLAVVAFSMEVWGHGEQWLPCFDGTVWVFLLVMKRPL